MTITLPSVAKLAVVASLTAGLAGCANTGKINPLAFAPVSLPSIAGSGSLLGPLQNGILPTDAVAGLTKAERMRALEAEYQALEKAPLGQKVAWQSQTGAASGEVTAGTPYQVGQQNCRQYVHTATINGSAVTGQGAACRNDDGSWSLLS